MRMPDAHGGQKRVLSPLKLELQTVVSWHMGAGNGAWFLWKSSQHPLPLNYFSSCMCSYLWPSAPRRSYLFLEGQKITEESRHQAHTSSRGPSGAARQELQRKSQPGCSEGKWVWGIPDCGTGASSPGFLLWESEKLNPSQEMDQTKITALKQSNPWLG